MSDQSQSQELLTDIQLTFVNKINSYDRDRLDYIDQLVKIEIYDGNHITAGKIKSQLTQTNKEYTGQLSVDYRLRLYDRINDTLLQLQDLRFSELSDVERYYVIKIIFERNGQKCERYIDEVLNMMEKQQTKNMAKRIYNHLPPAERALRFDQRIAATMQEQARAQKLSFLREGQDKIDSLPKNKKITGLACKDRFLEWLAFLRDLLFNKK